MRMLWIRTVGHLGHCWWILEFLISGHKCCTDIYSHGCEHPMKFRKQNQMSENDTGDFWSPGKPTTCLESVELAGMSQASSSLKYVLSKWLIIKPVDGGWWVWLGPCPHEKSENRFLVKHPAKCANPTWDQFLEDFGHPNPQNHMIDAGDWGMGLDESTIDWTKWFVPASFSHSCICWSSISVLDANLQKCLLLLNSTLETCVLKQTASCFLQTHILYGCLMLV